MKRVLLVEKDLVIREMLAILVDEHRVVCVEPEEVTAYLRQTRRVDLLVMGISIIDGLESFAVLKEVKQKFPWLKSIVVTDLPGAGYLDYAKELGVESFWYKKGAIDSFLEVVERTLKGESVYPGQPWERTIGKTTTGKISSREREVLTGLVCGATDEEIAEKLHVSLRTIKTHIQHMREKTGTRNRTELAVQARGCGFVLGELP